MEPTCQTVFDYIYIYWINERWTGKKANNNLGTNWRVLHTSRKIPPRSFVPFSVGLGQMNIDYLVFAIWKYNDFASFLLLIFCWAIMFGKNWMNHFDCKCFPIINLKKKIWNFQWPALHTLCSQKNIPSNEIVWILMKWQVTIQSTSDSFVSSIYSFYVFHYTLFAILVLILHWNSFVILE